MPVHDAGYISRPGNPGGVKGVRADPDGDSQTGDSNDDGPAHDAVILSKFSPKPTTEVTEAKVRTRRMLEG